MGEVTDRLAIVLDVPLFEFLSGTQTVDLARLGADGLATTFFWTTDS